MPSIRLAVLFILLGVWVGFKVHYSGQEELTWLLIPIMLVLATIWALRPQIDFWWHQKFPPELDPMGRKIVEQYPFYQQLTEVDQAKFRSRTDIFINNKSFLAMGSEEVPDDIKIMVAANAVILTLDQDDFLLEPFDQIVFYVNSFPSPLYPGKFHNSEMESEDGTLIFSLKTMLPSQINSSRRYNIVLHEWAKVLLHKYPDYLTTINYSWEELEQISGLSKQDIEIQVGLPIDDIRPVILHHKIWFSDYFDLAISKK